MNLKNQPTVFMPVDTMFDVERDWSMSKAAWMDVAFDYAKQICGTEDTAEVMKELHSRAELIRMYRKQEKSK